MSVLLTTNSNHGYWYNTASTHLKLLVTLQQFMVAVRLGITVSHTSWQLPRLQIQYLPHASILVLVVPVPVARVHPLLSQNSRIFQNPWPILQQLLINPKAQKTTANAKGACNKLVRTYCTVTYMTDKMLYSIVNNNNNNNNDDDAFI